MNITENWNQIRQHVNKSFSSSLHVSIASVDEDGNPTVTPIGSLFLNKDQTGFYFAILYHCVYLMDLTKAICCCCIFKFPGQ